MKNFGAAAFEELIKKAEGFFDYYLNRLCKLHDINSDKGQQAVLAGMAEAVLKTNDAALFERYAQKTAARVGVGRLAATPAFRAAFEKTRARSAPERGAEPQNISRHGPTH